MNPLEPIPQAGYRIRPWCQATGISDQMLYLLVRQGRGPHLVRVGRRLTIITEPPADYLARMALENGQTSPPAPTPARPATKAPLARKLPRPRAVPGNRKKPSPQDAAAAESARQAARRFP